MSLSVLWKYKVFAVIVCSMFLPTVKTVKQQAGKKWVSSSNGASRLKTEKSFPINKC